MRREAMARSVVPSMSAEIPTPLPPPVTVMVACGFSFIYISASSCVSGNTVSLPLMRWADNMAGCRTEAVKSGTENLSFSCFDGIFLFKNLLERQSYGFAAEKDVTKLLQE